jgi:lysophospholipid acyltransferase
MWGVLSIVLKTYFPHKYLTTEEFGTKNFLYKILYLNISTDGVKYRYYSGFKLAESGAIATGYSYTGIDQPETEMFNRTDMMITMKTELGYTPKEIIDGWNVQITHWLRNYSYLRILPIKMQKPSPARSVAAMYVTMIVSAIWHGYYLSYYVFFIQIAMYN